MIENQQMEWKEVWRDENLKTICGFANAQGGKLLIGVNDKGKNIGVKNFEKLLSDLPNKIIQFLGVIPDILLIKRSNIPIIEISVLPSSVPISYKGKFFLRSGSTTQELKGSELQEFILRKDNTTWDALPAEDSTFNDIDKGVVDKFVRKAVQSNRLISDASLSDYKLLFENLNLLTIKGELTRAAILLFGKRPTKFFPTAILKIGRFGLSDADLISYDIIDSNIFEMPEKAVDILRNKYLHSNISYDKLQRMEKLEYPESALREAVLNAIVHRNYSSLSDIQIKVYSDRLKLWNPGQIMEPLKIEMLKREHPSLRRNPLIANIFFRAGLIEIWGRGTISIIS